MVFLLFFLFLFICYGSLILYYWQGWSAIPIFKADQNVASIFISIIVPARNEEKSIANLLEALERQDYPGTSFEIIVVDDHSSDSTPEIVKRYPHARLLRLEDDHINSYKKKAIEIGIAAASGELIITTDADCIPGPGWLRTIVGFKEKTGALFIVAPVTLQCTSALVQIFQALDFLVLQGITGASVFRKFHSMCNGANLAYERKAFFEIGGFKGIDHIASGDDMLLMHKFAAKYPNKIHYLKSEAAIVSTLPMPTLRLFFNQRIRWASKATYYTDKRILWVLLLVYVFNFSFAVMLLAGFWNHFYWLYLLLAILLKTLVELPFVVAVAKFFARQRIVRYFLFFQPLHILYTIFAGFFGQLGSYEWKGRRVK